MRTLLNKIRKLLKDRRTRRLWSRTISVVAALVVFVTTYALVLPAITMERQAYCGIEAHQHTDECFERQLICTIPESPGHHHDDSCYTMRQEYSCTLEEHTHAEGCYDEEGNLICEIPEHTHEEGTCWQEVPELTCTLEESDGHLHDDSCYENVLVCGKEVHTHSEACYENPDETLETAAVATTVEGAYGISSGEGFDGSDADSSGDTNGSGDEIGWTDSDEYGNAARSDAALSDDPSTGLTDSDNAANSINAAGADAAELDAAGADADGSETADADALGEEAQQDLTSGGISEEEDRYVPQLDPLAFDSALRSRTGIYYYHVREGEVVEDSSLITEWKKVDKNTELGPNDLLRVYLSYTISAGSLNETNPTASYRLPANLHLTDDQVNGINAVENGIAAAYIDYNTLTVTDPDNYHRYLGAEAVEGTRTPGQTLAEYLAQNNGGSGNGASGNQAGQEFISATVRAQNVYDTEGLYGEKGAYLGQDLIFTFSPYTIEKNQHTYDASGQPTRAGEKVRGWFAIDFNLGQVDLDEPYIEEIDSIESVENVENVEGESDFNRGNENADEYTGEENIAVSQDGGETSVLISRELRTADIVFVEKDTSRNLDEISTSIKVVTAENYERAAENSDAAENIDNTDNSEEIGEEQPEERAEDSAEDLTGQEAETGEDAEGAESEDKKDEDKTGSQDEEPEKAIMPAMSFEDSIRVRTGKPTGVEDGSAGSAAASAAEALPKKAKVTVRVEADEGTFPAGTTMVLSAVEDLDAVAETVKETVESVDGDNNGNTTADTENKNPKTYGFQAVDISFRDADGNEIEPAKPVRVALSSEIVEQIKADKESSENTSIADPVVVHLDDDGNAEKMDLIAPEEIQPAQGKTAEELREEQAAEDENLTNPATDTQGSEGQESPGQAAEEDGEAENSSVFFETNLFSVYAIVYTVDFHYEVNGKMYEFSIPGGGFASFYKIVEVLGISEQGTQSGSGDENATENSEIEYGNGENTPENDVYNAGEETGVEDTGTYSDAISLNSVEVSEATKQFVADVASVEFSSPELVWVGKASETTTVGGLKEANGLEVQYSTELTEEQIAEINSSTVEAGDWALISVLPFDTEESLTVTMKNGDQFVVKVTDAQIKKSFISASGDTYEITVTYGPEAQIPDGAELKVREILPEDEIYDDYYKLSLEKAGVAGTEDDEETEETAEEAVSAEEVVEDSENTNDLISSSDSEEAEQDVNQTSDYARIFDIQIWAENHEIQPKSAVTVNIRLLDAPEESIATPSVVHFAKAGAELMELAERAENSENEGIQFTTDEFSVYSVIYTVDFHFDINGKKYDFSIEGGNAITFREATELFKIIEIEEVDTFINNIAKVEFSNPDYLWVGKVDENIRIGELKEKNHLEVEYSSELKQGNIDAINIRTIKAPDWVLVSLKPFSSEETLTVTMKNGEAFTIQVTDAQDDAVIKPDGTVQTIANPAGTTIDLFDYWIVDAYRDTAGRDAWPGHYRYPNGPMYSEFYQFDLYYPDGTYACAWDDWGFSEWHNGVRYTRDDLIRGNGNNQGINAGHNFKFTPGVGETVIDGTKGVKANDGNYGVNSWTTNASPRPGLVIGNLVNGYPKLTTDTSLGTDGSSLDYLFNSSNGTGKEAYTGVNQLLYVDKDGYYTFDSNDFDAQFNKSSKTFTVSPQTNPTGGARGFWPFGNQVYWHGMHINTQFSMPADGKVLSPNGNYNDMIFEFQGDDDTWVYVDGVLVGDGGGIHNQTRIVVNFREGTVLVSGEYDVRSDYRTDYHVEKYLDDLYRDAGVYDQYQWVDSPTVPGHKTFAPNSYHTFDMFYLERGGGESNLYIHYNMIATYDFTAHKSYHNNTNDRLYRDEFKFELIGLDGQYKNGVLTDTTKAAIMPKGGTAGGSGNVGDAQKVHYPASGDSPGYTYFKVGVSEDGNVNFGVADFSSQEMADCDVGNPSTYRYIIREVVPDEAVNEFGVAFKDATDEEKEEGGFKLGGITYDDKIYYMTATVTRWQENGQWKYGLSKQYYTDDTYTTQTSDNFASFMNGFVQPLTLEVLKKSDKGGLLLEGAAFSLTRAMHTDEQKWVPRHYVKNDEVIYAPSRTGTTSSQGTLTFDNLTEGHYILEETAPPEGYEAGETTRWLLTLTKQDADDEIALIPTITPLNEDGSVAGPVSDPIMVGSNHRFQYQILNGKPPVNVSLEKKWNDNGDTAPPDGASATFELRRIKDTSPVRVELLDSQGVKICDVSAFVGDTVKIYDSGNNDFKHHTQTPGWLAVAFGENVRTRSDSIAPNDSGWTISTRTVYELSGWNVVENSWTSTSNGQYTVKDADVNNGVVQLQLSDNYMASQTYGFDQLPQLYVSNSAGGAGTLDEVYTSFTLPGDGDGGNSWKKTFNDLPQMDDHGHQYSYYFKEVSHTPANYNLQTIEGNMGSTSNPLTGSGDVIITNSTPELPKISASKLWKDEQGNDITAETGLSGLEVQLTLYKGSEAAPSTEVKNGRVTQTVTGNGTATWYLLDEHADTSAYFVKETAVKLSSGDFIDVTTNNEFGGTVTGDLSTGYTVTNELPLTELFVTKQWKDGTAANADKVFDEAKTISFTLYQKLGSNDPTVYTSYGTNGQGTITYSPASGSNAAAWSTETIQNLPKYVYSDGTWHEAKYYPVESTVENVSITTTYQKGSDSPTETPSDAAAAAGTITIINTDVVVPIRIVKVDSNNTATGLSGAKFQLTRKLPGESIFTRFVHESFEEDTEHENKKTGMFTVTSTEGIVLENLLPGEYRIEEKVAPAGYIISLQPFTFTVGADGSVVSSDADGTLVFHLEKNGDNPEGFRIANIPGAELPASGGPGTRLYLLLGGALIAIAGALLVRRRRIS